MISPAIATPALELAALTGAGPVRSENEDHCGCSRLVDGEAGAILAVADGVSGCQGGATASRMAIEVLLEAYCEQPSRVNPGKRLCRAVQRANIEIHDLALMVPELRGMTTTLTAVALHEGHLHAAHVGDSRLYLVRDGTITQLTKDHNLAAARPRGAPDDPRRFVLTRSLGRELIVSIDRIIRPLRCGDILLLCTDGLYSVVPPARMAELVQEAGPEEACRALLLEAERLGAPDNVTAAVASLP